MPAPHRPDLLIGLMSGTSMDGIDGVLAAFPAPGHCVIHARTHQAFDPPLQALLRSIGRAPAGATLPVLASLDVQVAEQFAAAARPLLKAVDAGRIRGIGSHGQTVYHAPDSSPPCTVQLGDPGLIAVRTGLPVVADFRRGDVALGGQGAPLVPAFHAFAFGAAGVPRAVVNIGGIANVTLIGADGQVSAHDTGPGNALLDAWCQQHQSGPFDAGGQWAARGKVEPRILAALLADPWFARPGPKSTGTDYFNLAWLRARSGGHLATAPPENIQATLAELTACTIVASLGDPPAAALVAVCGGGARNTDLMGRLARLLPGVPVTTTAGLGIPPELVEAAAFAWMAGERLDGRATSLPAVTGARAPLSLGGVYLPPASYRV